MNEEFRELRDRIIERCFGRLNDEQMSAVLSDRDKVLVAACPGAGKTQVIISRVLYLSTFGATYGSEAVPSNLKAGDLAELRGFLDSKDDSFCSVPEILTRDSVRPENIVVITFTRMAAKGMEERYRGVSGKSSGPFFGTFHSLFYRILERRRGKLSIISEADANEAVRRVLCRYTDVVTEDKVTGVLNDISGFKNSRLAGVPFEPRTDSGIFRECLSAYEKLKEGKGKLDFDDIILECIKLFREDEALLSRYRKLFTDILVDEFQDCDSQQILLLKLFEPSSRIFAVGDEDQCIYGFRGSRPDCMVDFSSHFEGGRKYFLNRNYRSRAGIIGSAKRLIGFNALRNEKEMRAVREEKGSVNLMPCRDAMDQSEKAAEILSGLQTADSAVLYRTNRECGLLTATLLRKGIKFRTMEKAYNFLEEELCRDMLAYFRLGADPFDRESFIRVANRPNRFLGRALTEKVKGWPAVRNVFRLLSEQRCISLYQAREILKLEGQVRRLPGMKPGKAVAFVLKKLGYAEYLEKNEGLKPALEEFEALASGFGSMREFLDFADRYSLEIERSAEEQAGVVLSTIHGVKGLEYKNVLVINCSEGNMPHRNSFADIEEERRIFYVAVTRAADSLWLLWPEAMGESQFIKELIQEKVT